MEVDPGSINVVPGKVTLWVDVRGVDTASIQRTLKEIRQAAQGTARTDGVEIKEEMLTSDTPVALDEKMAAQSEAICKEQKKSFLHMNSGAGICRASVRQPCCSFPARAGSATTRKNLPKQKTSVQASKCWRKF